MNVTIDVNYFWDWVAIPAGKIVDDYYRWEPLAVEDYPPDVDPTVIATGDSSKYWPENMARIVDGQVELWTTDEVFKVDAQGNGLIRTVVNTPSHTDIAIPPHQVQNVIDAPSYDSVTNEAQSIAWWVSRMMSHNAPRDAWTAIHVHDGDHNAEVEDYLNSYFQMKPSKPEKTK